MPIIKTASGEKTASILSPHLLFLIFITFWAIFQIAWARPENVYNDWFSWRQAETQTIAKNFATREFNLFYPQINWSGEQGYVQTEFQLYTALTAMAMKITGIRELPGQLISLMCFIFIAWALFLALKDRFGHFASLFAIGIFLSNRESVFLSTSIQPDPLCFFFYTLAFITFLAYIRSPSRPKLFAWVLFTSLASLIKPTALSLGIFQFLYVVFTDHNRLRARSLWLGWGTIILIQALFLMHTYGIYVTYGNTFGVGTGGDSKFPSLKSLLSPVRYAKIGYMTLFWGLSVPGAAAGLYLLIKRKLTGLEWALIIANSAVLLVAFRFTSNRSMGQYYHLLTSLLGAWLAAHAIHLIYQHLQNNKMPLRGLSVLLALVIITQYGIHLYFKRNPLIDPYAPPEITAMGTSLARIVDSKDLVVVRSPYRSRISKYWGGGPNNFEDPRIFYIAWVRGWILPVDETGPDHLNGLIRQGARYYVETGPQRKDPSLYDWLEKNSVQLAASQHGRIYRFSQNSLPPGQNTKKSLYLEQSSL